MTTLLSLLFLLSLFFSTHGQYVVVTETDGERCTGMPTFVSILKANACFFFDGSYMIQTCSATHLSSKQCTDSLCRNCGPEETTQLGCNTTDSTMTTCVSSFPSLPSSSIVNAYHTQSACAGEASMWAIYEGEDDACTEAPGKCQDLDDASVYTVCSSRFAYDPTTKPPTPTQAPPNCTTGDCGYYLNCINKVVPCAYNDYASAFYASCAKYTNVLNLFSVEGRNWVNNLLNCLQQKLVPIISTSPTPTCDKLREEAMETHATCYLGDDSICSLVTDWPLIVRHVWDGVYDQRVLEALDTGSGCISLLIIKISNISISDFYYESTAYQLFSLFPSSPVLSLLDTTSHSTGAQKVNITFAVRVTGGEEGVTLLQNEFSSTFANQTFWPSSSFILCRSQNASECAVNPITTLPTPNNNPTLPPNNNNPSNDNSSGSALDIPAFFLLFVLLHLFN